MTSSARWALHLVSLGINSFQDTIWTVAICGSQLIWGHEVAEETDMEVAEVEEVDNVVGGGKLSSFVLLAFSMIMMLIMILLVLV